MSKRYDCNSPFIKHHQSHFTKILEYPMKQTSLFLLIVSILLTACTGATTPTPTAAPQLEQEDAGNSVIAEGVLIPVSAIELAFVQAGVVSEVFAQPGQMLAAGEPIARLAGIETIRAELAAAQLEQTLAQQALDQLYRDAFLIAVQAEQLLLDAQKVYEGEASRWNLGNPEDASDLELTLDDYIQAEQEYRQALDKLQSLLDKEETNRERRDAQDDFDREVQSLEEAYSDLLASKAENRQPLEDRHTRLLMSIANLEAARQQVERMRGNLDPDALAVAEARLQAATAHLAAVQATLTNFDLCAPFTGQLASLDVSIGESVLPGLPVAFFADTSSWIIETTDLAEIYIPSISLNDSVTVEFDAFPGEEFPGKVTGINSVGHKYQGDMTYQVTVTLESTDERFMWNMTASVTIAVEE
jgi:multidrug resistance efflux pump